MQPHRTEVPASMVVRPTPVPPPGAVRALGLSDALSVEFRPSQIPGLIEELDEMRSTLSETFEQSRSRWETAVSVSSDSESSSVLDAEEDMSRAGYALTALAAIRSQVPQRSSDEPVVVVGPSPTMSSAISAAALSAAISLAEILETPLRTCESSELREQALAALAWVETYLDCRAVEWYAFDPRCDPVRLER